MRKIENYEEFISLWSINHKNRYWGNKKITPEQEQEIIKKANLKDFKRYNIYVLDDGYYFIVDTKPTIDATLYYDDEMTAPEKSLNLFIKNNIRNLDLDLDNWKKEMESLKTIGVCSGIIEDNPFININFSGDSKEVCLCFYESFGNTRRNQTTIRNLTQKEIDEILKIAEEEKQKYIERLTKYYNKHGMNVVGYWAYR